LTYGNTNDIIVIPMNEHSMAKGAEAMHQVLTTITKKGQVTIPIEIRHSQGLGPGDKVAFVVEAGEVKVKPVKSALDRSFGAIKPRKRPEDFDELERLAEEAMAEDALRPLK
jgi:AbrB family looped-hinge helix DNA binding protein